MTSNYNYDLGLNNYFISKYVNIKFENEKKKIQWQKNFWFLINKYGKQSQPTPNNLAEV